MGILIIAIKVRVMCVHIAMVQSYVSAMVQSFVSALVSAFPMASGTSIALCTVLLEVDEILLKSSCRGWKRSYPMFRAGTG